MVTVEHLWQYNGQDATFVSSSSSIMASCFQHKMFLWVLFLMLGWISGMMETAGAVIGPITTRIDNVYNDT